MNRRTPTHIVSAVALACMLALRATPAAGRERPSENDLHTFAGFTLGQWDGGVLPARLQPGEVGPNVVNKR